MELKRRLVSGLFLSMMFAGTTTAQSQSLIPADEYEKRLASSKAAAPLSSDLFGDSTSLYNGSTEFSVVDIDIPGNGSLPVQLRRQFKVQSRKSPESLGGFGAWDIDVPYIYGTFPSTTGWNQGSPNGGRCSGLWFPVTPTGHRPQHIWSGNFLHVPGSGDTQILYLENNPLPADGQSYFRGTSSGFRFRCIAGGISNYPGEAFVGVDSNGTKYFFTHAASRDSGGMKGTPRRAPLGRTTIYFFATRIEDRHGNYVNYVYGGPKGGQLLSIQAGDGRRIDLDYLGGQTVRVARAHGRTWQYAYSARTGGLGISRFPLLKVVTLPDRSAWTYDYQMPMDAGGLSPLYTPEDTIGPPCFAPAFRAETLKFTVTHPSGARGAFEFPYVRQYRIGVDANTCVPSLENDEPDPTNGPYEQVIADYFDLYALTKKTISGPGLGTLQWTYDYGQQDGVGSAASAMTNSDCAAGKQVTVVNPDQTANLECYGNQFEVDDGQHLGSMTLAQNGSILARESREYVAYSQGGNYPFPILLATTGGGDDITAFMQRPMRKRTLEQDGETFVWEVATDCPVPSGLCYDVFARPTKVVKRNSVGFSRTDRTDYLDQLNTWTLGQVKSVTNVNSGLVESETIYNAQALPWKTYRFDQLQQTLTYDAAGMLSSVSDGRDASNFDTTVLTTDWFRGVPRSVQYPATTHHPAVFKMATVNDFGQITSVTDENTYTTSYSYDAVTGRIKEVTRPSGDASAWNKTFYEQVFVDSAEYGISGGHWRQTESTGSARKVTYMDGMSRPLVSRTYDSANEADTASIVAQRYDHDSRKVFQSYPLRSLVDFATNLPGVTTRYDALGRTVSSAQTSELGDLTSDIEYLPGLRMRTTDPRRKATTTHFQAFDQPVYDAAIEIDHPMSISTYIRRDVFGKPAEITRSGPD